MKCILFLFPSKVYLETDVERALRRFDLQCFIVIKILATCMPMTRATNLVYGSIECIWVENNCSSPFTKVS